MKAASVPSRQVAPK